MTINIFINGKKKKISSDTNIKKLICEKKLVDKYFALSLNENFIPKNNYKNIVLKNNDRIEIVTITQGG